MVISDALAPGQQQPSCWLDEEWYVIRELCNYIMLIKQIMFRRVGQLVGFLLLIELTPSFRCTWHMVWHVLIFFWHNFQCLLTHTNQISNGSHIAHTQCEKRNVVPSHSGDRLVGLDLFFIDFIVKIFFVWGEDYDFIMILDVCRFHILKLPKAEDSDACASRWSPDSHHPTSGGFPFIPYLLME